MVVVADASVLAAALVDAGKSGRWAEGVIADHELVAPQLILVETTNVLRRLERGSAISTLEANSALRDLLQLRLELFPFEPFAQRIWVLRDNLTSYDAWYVALAEGVRAPLATLDRKLANAVGPTCTFLEPG